MTWKNYDGPWEMENRKNERGDIVGINIASDNFIICKLPDGASTEGGFAFPDQLSNAKLITAAPDLLAEHKDWSKLLGHIIMEALQGNYDCLTEVKTELPITYINGIPHIESAAIQKAGAE